MKRIGVLQVLNKLTSMSPPSFRYSTDDRHGDGGKAHDLSAEGKRHQAEQDRLDDQASDWIFNGESPFTSSPYSHRGK